jgi:hypothetical protein
MVSMPYDPSRRIGEADYHRNQYVMYLTLQFVMSLAVFTLAVLLARHLMELDTRNIVAMSFVGFTWFLIGLWQAKSQQYWQNVLAWCCLSLATGVFFGVLAWLTGAALPGVMVAVIIAVIAFGFMNVFGTFNGLRGRTDWRLSAKEVSATFMACVLMSFLAGVIVGLGLAYFATLFIGLVVSLWTGYMFAAATSLDPTRLNTVMATAALYADFVRQPLDAYHWRRDT